MCNSNVLFAVCMPAHIRSIPSVFSGLTIWQERFNNWFLIVYGSVSNFNQSWNKLYFYLNTSGLSECISLTHGVTHRKSLTAFLHNCRVQVTVLLDSKHTPTHWQTRLLTSTHNFIYWSLTLLHHRHHPWHCCMVCTSLGLQQTHVHTHTLERIHTYCKK